MSRLFKHAAAFRLFPTLGMWKSSHGPLQHFMRHPVLHQPSRISFKSFSTRNPRPQPVIKALPITVFVEGAIRSGLNLRPSDNKVKALMTIWNERDDPIKCMRDLIEKKIPELARKPYVLRYKLHSTPTKRPRQFDPLNTAATLDILRYSNDPQHRLQLHVHPNPSVNFPPPSLKCLENMPDPLESPTISIVSFYRFAHIGNATDFAWTLKSLWGPLRAQGRVYVAPEGINAQMAIPTTILTQFKEATEQCVPELHDLFMNIDHVMKREEYDAFQPFDNLHIRVRDQIVADGLLDTDNSAADAQQQQQQQQQRSLDCTKPRKELSAEEWNRDIEADGTIVLDCRNSYESDIGKFVNAEPLQTTYFRESWDVLQRRLNDVAKDSPIRTYCTGGIRCVKINAYLEDVMGFTNVASLKGGIINYSRQMQAANSVAEDGNVLANTVTMTTTQGKEEIETAVLPSTKFDLTSAHMTRHIPQSKFIGHNYVFDARMSAQITNTHTTDATDDDIQQAEQQEVISLCETCGTKCAVFSNCANTLCHVRYIQCKNCQSVYNGCCSEHCRITAEQIELNKAAKIAERRKASTNDRMIPRLPRAISSQEQHQQRHDIAVGVMRDKALQHFLKSPAEPASSSSAASASSSSSASSSVMEPSYEAIAKYCEEYSEAESAPLRLVRERTEQEFPHAMRMLSDPTTGRLLTHLVRSSKSKNVLEIGTFTGYATLCLAEGISDSSAEIITCELDAKTAGIAKQSFDSCAFGQQITQYVGDGLDTLKKFKESGRKFDFVFLDADKKVYRQYLDLLLGVGSDANGDSTSACMLTDGATVVIDNTLWKGLVVAQANPPEAGEATLIPLDKTQERFNKIAKLVHEFNAYVCGHPHLKTLMLPLRDGLTICTYHKPREMS